jgi:hypothetical protein
MTLPIAPTRTFALGSPISFVDRDTFHETDLSIL